MVEGDVLEGVQVEQRAVGNRSAGRDHGRGSASERHAGQRHVDPEDHGEGVERAAGEVEQPGQQRHLDEQRSTASGAGTVRRDSATP